MGIKRSTYYYRPKRDLAKKKRDADIADLIEAIAYQYPYYGYRRVTAALKRKKMVINHKKVLKMMKKMNIQCRKAKRFVSTTNSSHNLKVYPNLAKDLVVDKIDKLWCADITYIRILTGFVYLAAIIDAFSRKIVATALAGHLLLNYHLKHSRWLLRIEIQMILLITLIKESSTAAMIISIF